MSPGPQRLISANEPMMRTLSTAGIAILAVATAAPASVPTTFAATIPWRKDFRAALGEARATSNPVLIDFWAQWCEWCHKLDATT